MRDARRSAGRASGRGWAWSCRPRNPRSGWPPWWPRWPRGSRSCWSTTPSATPPRSVSGRRWRWPARSTWCVVVGGRNSGNTTRLAELCARGAAAHPSRRSRPRRSGRSGSTGVGVVGVTAGASTPPEQIEAVVARSSAGRRDGEVTDDPVQLPRWPIVGYPNVGKSTLFNRLTGTREAVVAPEAGRHPGPQGGAGRVGHPRVRRGRHRRHRPAGVRAAGRPGARPGPPGHRRGRRRDLPGRRPERASVRRSTRSPTSCAGAPSRWSWRSTRSMPARRGAAGTEFWELGLGEPVGVSAEHGLGTGDLLDAVVAALPTAEELPEDEGLEPVRIAIVGRPNVGKSSLVNALLGNERVIVSPIPGTTRDAIDTPIDATKAGRSPWSTRPACGGRASGRPPTSSSTVRSAHAPGAWNGATWPWWWSTRPRGSSTCDLQVAYEAQRANCATAVLFNKWDIADDRPGHGRRAALRARCRCARPG